MAGGIPICRSCPTLKEEGSLQKGEQARQIAFSKCSHWTALAVKMPQLVLHPNASGMMSKITLKLFLN